MVEFGDIRLGLQNGNYHFMLIQASIILTVLLVYLKVYSKYNVQYNMAQHT